MIIWRAESRRLRRGDLSAGKCRMEDEHQLESIGDDSTVAEKVAMIKKIFNHHRVLKSINRRMKTVEDARIMGSIQEDLFVHNMPVDGIIAKYFPRSTIGSLADVTNLGIRRAVSYLDASTMTLTNLIGGERAKGAFATLWRNTAPRAGTRSMGCSVALPARGAVLRHEVAKAPSVRSPHPIEIVGTKYYTGMSLTCKRNTNIKPLNDLDGDTMMRCNYVYTVISIDETHLTLEDIDTGARYPVSHETISKAFILPYCNTVHSSQGGEIDEPFVIADVTMGSPEWFYTAISRATRIDDIHFLHCNMEESNMEAVFARKIQYAMQADVKRGLTIDDSTYITVADCKAMYGISRSCVACKQYMGYHKGSERQVTIDRIANHIGHIKGNCQLMCRQCNNAKR